MFDPFNDFETAGYLRNLRQDKNPNSIKRFEHDLFEANMDAALDHLAARRQLAYSDFLAVHKILFSDYYPWAGQDREATAPTIAVTKGDVVFGHPREARLAVEHGLRLGQDRAVMARKPGEVMGLFAYGHPFLDGNGRTMLLVHMELAHRAGFSIDWAQTEKRGYLDALSREIDTPGKGILDGYLLQFKAPQLERGQWGVHLLSMKGLDGLDNANQISGEFTDPAVAERYRNAVERRGYAYSQVRTLADEWKAIPARIQHTGRILALSEREVIQDIGGGQHVVWDRNKLRAANLAVGQTATIRDDGSVKQQPLERGKNLTR